MTNIYHICIKGHLDVEWSGDFGAMALRHLDNSVTLLFGPVVDQAALHGILARVRDLGLPLLSVQRVGELSPYTSPAADHMLLLVHVCSNFGPKIVYPRLPGPRTRRQRLIERLDAGLPAMLTLACAPAGFGKTTLLAEWIAQSDEGRGTNANLQEAQAIEAKGGPV